MNSLVRAARRRWYAGAGVALIFLVLAMLQATDGPVGQVVAFELLALCFAACYLLVPPRVTGARFAPPASPLVALKAWGSLAGMVALTVPMIALGGSSVTSLWIYVSVAGAVMLRPRAAMLAAVVLALAMLTVGAAATGLDDLSGLAALPWELSLTLVALTLWMVGFIGNLRTTHQLRQTQHELARTAVEAERARIGRDLHDILGHSLTAITVKSALAARLIGRDAAAAGTEIADVERLARSALADVRATAAGYRDMSLAGELAVARSVLEAAGIAADIPHAVDNVEAAGREVFGYVVREAVTNVVRHSGAAHCRIDLTPQSVIITDDGDGGTSGGSSGGASGGAVRPGGGLTGMAERMAAAGGALDAGPVAGGGFRVTATVAGTDRGIDARAGTDGGIDR